MKTFSLVFVASLTLLSACSFFHRSSDTAETLYPMLDTADAFDSAKVAAWHPTQAARDYALELYHRGTALFVKEHNDTAAFALLRQSLRIAPDAYAYLQMIPVAFRLGRDDLVYYATILAENDKRTKAQAEMWDARLGMTEAWDGLAALEKALQDDPFAVETVEQDTFFRDMRSSASFQALIAKYRYLASPEHKSRALLDILLSRTSLAQMPYVIPPDSLYNREVNTIAPIFKDILPGVADGRGEWSRSMNQEYDLRCELPLSPSYHAIVYSSSLFFIPWTPVQYYIATIDTSGHFIDAMKAGCFCSPLHVQTLQVDTGGLITLTRYDQQWQYPPEDSGYINNTVTHRDSTGTEYFRIMYDGKIIATEPKPL